MVFVRENCSYMRCDCHYLRSYLTSVASESFFTEPFQPYSALQKYFGRDTSTSAPTEADTKYRTLYQDDRLESTNTIPGERAWYW